MNKHLLEKVKEMKELPIFNDLDKQLIDNLDKISLKEKGSFVDKENKILDIEYNISRHNKEIIKLESQKEKIIKEKNFLDEQKEKLVDEIIGNDILIGYLDKEKTKAMAFFTKLGIFIRLSSYKKSNFLGIDHDCFSYLEDIDFETKNTKKINITLNMFKKLVNIENTKNIDFLKLLKKAEDKLFQFDTKIDNYSCRYSSIKEYTFGEKGDNSYLLENRFEGRFSYIHTMETMFCYYSSSSDLGRKNKSAIFSNFYGFTLNEALTEKIEENQFKINQNIAYEILNIFIENDLEICFSEENKQIYELIKERHNLLKQSLLKKEKEELSVVSVEANKTPKHTMPKINFEYLAELEKYKINETDIDLVDYYRNTSLWSDMLLSKIKELEEEYSEVFKSMNKYKQVYISLKNNNLPFYNNRADIFNRQFAFSFESMYKSILSLKEDSEKIEKDLNQSLNEFNFEKLAIIENSMRPSFRLLAKHSAEQVKSHIYKIEKLSNLVPIADKILEINSKWSTDYENISKKKAHYIKSNSEGDIDETLSNEWFDELLEERGKVEYKLNNLFESSLRGIIDLEVLEILENKLFKFKDSLDKLYEEERISIHHKCAFLPGSEMHESFEVKDFKFKKLNEFIKEIENVLVNTIDPEVRRWLIKWNNDWFSNEIADNLSILNTKEAESLFLMFSENIRQIKENNLKEFYNDVNGYMEHIKQREKEYNSLVFRMRKELSKQGGIK